MTHYFFDIDDGETFTADQVGTDYESPETMRAAAIDVLPDIARDELPNSNDRVFSVEVREEGGQRIFLAKLTLHAEWLNGK